MLTFRQKDKKRELEGELLKTMTNKNCNVDLAKLRDEKLLFEFAREMFFDEEALGNKSTGDKTRNKLPKLPAIKTGSLKSKSISEAKTNKTRFSTSNPNELCDWLNLLLQEKQVGIFSDKTNEEMIAIADNLLDYKCRPTKRQLENYK